MFVTFLVLWILSTHHLSNFLEAINLSGGGGLGGAADLFCDGAVRGARAVRAAAGNRKP